VSTATEAESGYRAVTLALAAQAEQVMADVLALPLPDPAFVAVGAAAVAAAASRAVALADLSLAATLSPPDGPPLPTLGLTLPEDVLPRVTAGLRTLAAEAPAVEVDAARLASLTDDELRALAARVTAARGRLAVTMPGAAGLRFDEEGGRASLAAVSREQAIGRRAARLARGESLAAGQRAYTEGMTRRKVRGWTRVTGPTPCPLCAGLAARAEVLPASHRMARHTGCSCVQRPTTTTRPTRGRTDDAA
jgi:hypothetical protein